MSKLFRACNCPSVYCTHNPAPEPKGAIERLEERAATQAEQFRPPSKSSTPPPSERGRTDARDMQLMAHEALIGHQLDCDAMKKLTKVERDHLAESVQSALDRAYQDGWNEACDACANLITTHEQSGSGIGEVMAANCTAMKLNGDSKP